ncbi:MAG: AAA family ATPase [Nannocystaceae bacterium]
MLESISLYDFKSFEEVEVELGRLTLVVGANASGKSNLRDALRFLHGVGLGYPLAEIIGEKYGPGGILAWRGIRGGTSEIATHGCSEFTVGCQLTGPRSDWLQYQLTVEVGVGDQDGPRVINEYLSRQDYDDYFFDSAPDKDPVRQQGDHQIRVRHSRGGRYRAHGKVSSFSSSRPVLSQMVERPKEIRTTRDACSKTLEVLQSMRFLDLDPEAMREPSLPGQVVLGDRGENLSSVLQSICNDAMLEETLMSWIRALTPMDAVGLDFVQDFRGRVLVHLVESDGARTSALSASDGTLRFLALIAALLSPDTGRLYFFEEFDNGIHPTRLHLLLQLVQQTCERQGIQVIGTTHNPAMLAFLDEDAREHALLVYRPDGSRYSKVRSIMALPDIERIIATQDLGRLHAAGWLEDAAELSELDDDDEAGEP